MAINWRKNYKKYRGLWIALDGKERKVVASDKEAKKAFERAKRKGVEDMKFKYQKIGVKPSDAFPVRKFIFKPSYPVILEYEGKKVGYNALIDFCADYNIFHAQIGEILGI